jgi:hypothetical protein
MEDLGIIGDWLRQRETRGARESLLRLGRKRFGEPSEAILQTLAQIDSAALPQEMVERTLEVENWQELLEAIPPEGEAS